MAEYRRHLPHFHPDGAYLFVTWRLAGSLPALPPGVIYPTPGHAFAAQDRALHQSHAPAWLRDPHVAREVVKAIRAGEGERNVYELQAWVVMPNHVHVLLLPHASLRTITHWIKGRTARQGNRLLGRSVQTFWQRESYDHWVRSEREFQRIVSYIEGNPVLAGLADSPQDWPWSSAHWAS
jgi:putative transposase